MMVINIEEILVKMVVILERDMPIEPTSVLHNQLRDFMISENIISVDSLLKSAEALDKNLGKAYEESSLDYIDIMKNLFTAKYGNELKRKVVSRLEQAKTLQGYIKKYQPKYWDKDNNTIMYFNLLTDLGWFRPSIPNTIL
jgi:hypothetical protein